MMDGIIKAMNYKILISVFLLMASSVSCKEDTDSKLFFEIENGPVELNVSDKGMEQEYSVQSNAKWQIIHKGLGTWVNVKNKTGENDGSFQVVIDKNTSKESRSLTLGVLLNGKEHSKHISISQDKAGSEPSEPTDEYPIEYNSFRVRDPFIFPDPVSKKYYLHVHADDALYPFSPNQIGVIISEDLKYWKKGGISFSPPADFWGKKDFWAPDLYYYKEKYYLFATFSDVHNIRGSSILVSNSPEGPFVPLVNSPITPQGWMALDASLYIDDEKQPWMAFSHEWTEVTDGTIVVQQLSEDLKTTVGAPITIFRASEAPWVIRGSYYVSDAPFLYKASNGHLLMIWSSFIKAPDDRGIYAIGVARSKSGSILGPWEHDPKPLNSNDDGGHAMIFRDFDGNLKISYHSPNTPGGSERLTIHSIIDNNGELSIIF